jgi:hypothetical protein
MHPEYSSQSRWFACFRTELLSCRAKVQLQRHISNLDSAKYEPAPILALVILAFSPGLTPVARSFSEAAASGSLSTSKTNVVGRHEDSDFIGTPEEIYVKVKARRDSLGLDLECTQSTVRK